MILITKKYIQPKSIRLDASTVCQLKCPSCPTASGATSKSLGAKFLKFEDFKRFVHQNQNISHIELSNWGEVFLNKDLTKILRYAYRHNVTMNIVNGANLNLVHKGVLEALVKYKVRSITCSIDGASQETYKQYRVNGNFDNVINNIKEINAWKDKYNSRYPELLWQFVAFGHNEHEIHKARAMAEELNMQFFLKLSWDDLYGLTYESPIKDKEFIRKETGTGAADRKEHMEKFGKNYKAERTCCTEIWRTPQINPDGRLLGCPINYWGDFGNVFKEGLDNCLNGEKINYARDMLMGRREEKAGIPCTTCNVYKRMKENGSWITPEETQLDYFPGRKFIMFENKILGKERTRWVTEFIYRVRTFLHEVKKAKVENRLSMNIFSTLIPKVKREADHNSTQGLPNKGYDLSIPLQLDGQKKWKPYFLFRGATKGMKDFSCHASVLESGHTPHPPHTHREDEILMMLSGQAKLMLPQYQGQGPLDLRPGEFVFYPSGFSHTLQTTSAEPASYLMFKWYAPGEHAHKLSFGKYLIHDYFRENQKGLTTSLLFEGSSKCTKRLQAHVSVLSPNAGYAAHADPYDVAIVVLEGEVKTLGKKFGPHSVIFHPAGKRHGLSNPGKIPAKYIVFEFQN